eukprot:scaffold3848_cov198-Alexandrium_tamarense.AAC.3
MEARSHLNDGTQTSRVPTAKGSPALTTHIAPTLTTRCSDHQFDCNWKESRGVLPSYCHSLPTDYSLSPRSPQPFSQYNRIKLLEETEYSIGTSSLPGLEDVDPMKLLSASKSEVRKLRKESIVKMLDESPFKVNNKKRAHVKTHGKMGFLEMSKTMSKLWKNCDDETKSIFRQVSNEGKAKFQKNILDNYKAQAQRKPTLIPMLTTAQLPSFDFLKKACKMQAPPPLKSDAAAARFHKRTITPPEHGLQAASFSGMYAMALPQMMIPPLAAITLRQTPMPICCEVVEEVAGCMERTSSSTIIAIVSFACADASFLSLRDFNFSAMKNA